jgi:hypothetical protein
MNGFMKERMTQLELERDGIERSLNQQIAMYKKMLHDSEFDREQRLKEDILEYVGLCENFKTLSGIIERANTSS